MAATVAETRANSREIEKLRQRNHDFGNELQATIAGIENLGTQVEAMHTSVKGRIAELKADVKEDLREIKEETAQTNGRVAEHDRQISRLQGGLIVVGALAPVFTSFAVFLLPRL